MKDVLVAALGLAALAYLYTEYQKKYAVVDADASMPNKLLQPKTVELNIKVKSSLNNTNSCNDCSMVNDYKLPSFDAKGFMKF